MGLSARGRKAADVRRPGRPIGMPDGTGVSVAAGVGAFIALQTLLIIVRRDRAEGAGGGAA